MFKKPPSAKARSSSKAPNLSAQDARKAKLQRARAAELKTVMEIGAQPEQPSTFFVPCKHDFYNVPIEFVVACKMTPGTLDAELGHRNRTNRRRMFYVNCGMPSAQNQDAGKVLWGDWGVNAHGVLECAPWEAFREPLPREMYEYCLVDPMVQPGKKKQKAGADASAAAPEPVADPSRVPDPSVDFVIGKERMYSDADIAGRYAGWKALTTPATLFWTTIVLGFDIDYATGKPITAFVPSAKTKSANNALYFKQQEAVRGACRKFYLVCPYPVDGCFGPEGELYPLGELDAAKAEDRDPVPIAYDTDEEAATYAPQPVQFVSIVSDKREGVPGAGHTIAGYHDTTRAWPLQPPHIEQLKKILQHYGLEDEFPALARLHVKRTTSMLDLNMLRQMAIELHGDPPPRPCTEGELVCKNWLAGWSKLPFGKVWVQKCDRDHPNGHVLHGTNTPVVVPLRKDRAEERNGISWLDVEKIDRSTPAGEQHYVKVQTMLHRIVGKSWNKGLLLLAGSKRKADGDDDAAGDADGSIRASLERASEAAKFHAKRNAQLADQVEALKAEVATLKAEKLHMKLYGTSNRPAIVDFMPGRDAKCIIRWDHGKVDVHVGDQTIKVDCADHTFAVRFMPTNEALPAFPLLLENNAADDEDDDSN